MNHLPGYFQYLVSTLKFIVHFQIYFDTWCLYVLAVCFSCWVSEVSVQSVSNLFPSLDVPDLVLSLPTFASLNACWPKDFHIPYPNGFVFLWGFLEAIISVGCAIYDSPRWKRPRVLSAPLRQLVTKTSPSLYVHEELIDWSMFTLVFLNLFLWVDFW